MKVYADLCRATVDFESTRKLPSSLSATALAQASRSSPRSSGCDNRMPITALAQGVVSALGSSQVLTTPVSVVKVDEARRLPC